MRVLQNPIDRKLQTTILFTVLGLSLLLLSLFGCLSSEAPRRHDSAITLKDVVCRHAVVICLGGVVTVKGRTPEFWLNGMSASSQLLYHVDPATVSAIDVCTSKSCLSSYPGLTKSAVIHIYTED